MSSEILAVLEYMEKEKGISREDMIATIENAVKTAAEEVLIPPLMCVWKLTKKRDQ